MDLHLCIFVFGEMVNMWINDIHPILLLSHAPYTQTTCLPGKNQIRHIISDQMGRCPHPLLFPMISVSTHPRPSQKYLVLEFILYLE